MYGILAPFGPKYGSTIKVTAGAAQDVNVDPHAKNLMITNVGTDIAFIRCKLAGDTTAASEVDLPVLGNTQVTISKSGDGPRDGHSLVSIFSAGAPTIYVTSGEGW